MSDAIRRIHAPFDESTARSLRAGDRVLVSGTILAARDAAHKRLVEALNRGESLPVDLRGQVVYYVGPSPASPGHVIGSAGPTTAGRMDAYTPALLAQGLRGMIGKGYRSPAVVEPEHSLPAVFASIRFWPMKIWGRKPWPRWRSRTFPPSWSSTAPDRIITKQDRLPTGSFRAC